MIMYLCGTDVSRLSEFARRTAGASGSCGEAPMLPYRNFSSMHPHRVQQWSAPHYPLHREFKELRCSPSTTSPPPSSSCPTLIIFAWIIISILLMIAAAINTYTTILNANTVLVNERYVNERRRRHLESV